MGFLLWYTQARAQACSRLRPYLSRKEIGMKKISVIIPVFNSEKFVRQCIRSVLCQTYRNLEILVVDDGSQDGSLAICSRLCAQDGRIRVFHQENRGVSAARNRGLEKARGEYVFFLDSDDAIHPFLLEELTALVEENGAGLAMCDYRQVSSGQMERILRNISDCHAATSACPVSVASADQAREWFHITCKGVLAGIGGKLIRRELIGNRRFHPKLINGEDTLFLHGLVCAGIRIAYLRCGWYYYRRYSESTTHSQRMVAGRNYFLSSQAIRDREYRRGETEFALAWERLFLVQMQRHYLARREEGDRDSCRRLRARAQAEKEHPLFLLVPVSMRLLFLTCFFCRPLYFFLEKLFEKNPAGFFWKMIRAVLAVYWKTQEIRWEIRRGLASTDTLGRYLWFFRLFVLRRGKREKISRLIRKLREKETI